jgi:hypothetical protein
MVMRATTGTTLKRRSGVIASEGRNQTDVPAKKNAKKASALGRL